MFEIFCAASRAVSESATIPERRLNQRNEVFGFCGREILGLVPLGTHLGYLPLSVGRKRNQILRSNSGCFGALRYTLSSSLENEPPVYHTETLGEEGES